MKLKEISIDSGAGGLNTRDHPSRIAKDEFSKLENFVTDEGGWPGKGRMGKDLIQYAPIKPSPFRGITNGTITALPAGAGPGLITVQCPSTIGLYAGARLDFWRTPGPAYLETATVVAVLSATQFTITVANALNILTDTFSERGTLNLWHFDTLAGAVPDDSFNGVPSAFPSWTNLAVSEVGGRTCPSVAGLFPTAGPLARQTQPAVNGLFFSSYGHYFNASFTDLFHGVGSVFFDIWVYILPTISGQPVTIDITGAGDNFTFSNSGAHLLGTRPQLGFGGPGNIGEVRNGLTVHRDWDATAGKHAGDPYVKFTLRTSASPTPIVLNSGYLPTGRWLFIRGSYIQATGKVRLRVNGELRDESSATGTVDESFNGVPGILNIGGSEEAQFTPFFANLQKGFDGYVEEARIRTDVTEADEALQPFKNPRGKPWPLKKANGVNQLVVAADDGLFFTVGDGYWTEMGSGFSTSAFWDAVQIGDLLYLQNGFDSPKVWDGNTLYPWGEGTATLTLTAQAGVGLGVVGLVEYVYTFLFGSQETGPSVVSSITLAAATDEVDITNIPLGPPGCTGRRIYRKKIGGAPASAVGKYCLLRTINDNITTSLTGAYTNNADPALDTGRDGKTDATIGAVPYSPMSATVQFTKMPVGKYLLAVHNRAWVAGVGNDPYTLFWSELNTPGVFLVQNFVRAQADAGVLLGLAKYYGEIHVSKGGKATLVLRGDNPSNWVNFETLHPTIGAVDHWSFVHRTTPGSDTYRLCFMAEDGFYEYAGNDFVKISDKINGTFRNVAQGNANRVDTIVTTRADWEAAPTTGGGGTATQNLFAPSYSVDGMRQFAGRLQIVNQLEYIGLNLPAASIPSSAHVTFMAKGPAEGEFYFGMDNSNNLWRTTDNFATVAACGVSPLPANEVPIEVIRKGATDEYFVISSGNGATGGKVYKWKEGTSTWTTVMTATPLFWRSTVASRFSSSFAGFTFAPGAIPAFQAGCIGALGDSVLGSGGSGFGNKAIHTIGKSGYSGLAIGGNNFYADHTQNVLVTRNAGNPMTIQSATSLAGLNTGNLTDTFGGGLYSMTAGQFRAFRDTARYKFTTGLGNIYQDNTTNGFVIDFSMLEGPMWKGEGAARPQAFWDDANGFLFFVASADLNADGHATSTLYRLTDGAPGTLTAVFGPVTSFLALTPATASTAYFTSSVASGSGFGYSLYRINLGAAPTTTNMGAMTANLLPLRLGWNANTSQLLAVGKGYDVSAQNAYEYRGFFAKVNPASGATTVFKYMAVSNNVGSFPVEVAWHQISGTDSRFYAYALRPTATDTSAIWQVNDALTSASPFKAPFDTSTDMRSNLLFVAQSGAAGNYLWADRLYFGNVTALGGRPVQLGVPGNWTVKGVYESVRFDSGGMTAFNNLDIQYSGLPKFFMRNAASFAAIAGATYAGPLTPNSRITNFPTPAQFFQFKVEMEWTFTIGGSATTSPYVDSVTVSYFKGNAAVPRTVGFHWNGRTYWAVAGPGDENNSLVLVYQRNSAWTTYTNWRLKGMNEFLGQFVALEDYQLIRLETGWKDLGNQIIHLARTGYIMDDVADKCLRHFNVTQQSYVNADFPNKNGWMKVRAYGGNELLAAEWFFPILATATEEPRQVAGVFRGPNFPFSYARAYALEVLTSDDTSGTYTPDVGQVVNLASFFLQFFVSPPRGNRIVRN